MPETTTVAIPATPPWPEALAVAAQLRAAGFAAWCVGGCVRDLLLTRPVHDVDLATDAVPETVAGLFPRTVTVGKSFGVVVVVTPSGAHVEVATFRLDGRYLDHRRPEAVRFGSAVEDVQRRDFTINALLLDPLTGTVVDHVGGLADLTAGRIACVGDPLRRLDEDRLRVLRALRFAATLGFTLAPATAAAVAATPLSGLSAERLHQEWRKALALAPGAFLRLVQAHGRLPELTPPLAGVEPPALARVADALERAGGQAPLAVLLALWLAPAGWARVQPWLAQQPIERQLARQLGWLLEHLPQVAAWPTWEVVPRRRLARQPEAPLLAALVRALDPHDPASVAFAAAVAAEAATPSPPLVTAGDLLALGLAPGPRLGQLLRELEDLQLAGTLTDRAAALAAARTRLGGPAAR